MAVEPRRNGETVFIFHPGTKARRVFLAGDFNAWDPDDRRMAKRHDGSFQARLRLKPGVYHYKFVADGNWVHDPSHPVEVNSFGTANNVVSIAPNRKAG